MIRWAVWFFAALPLLLADAWLSRTLWPVPVLTLGFCLFCALFARTGAVPGLLVCVALARSVLGGGDAAVHVLVLGMPIAVLLPLRVLFSASHTLWQCAAAGFLAFALPKLSGLFARVLDSLPPPAPLDGTQVLWAVLLVPPASWLLQRLPPLAAFREAAS